MKISAPTTVSSTKPPPPASSPSSRVKVQYEEDGEVFEQEDTYNNVTGEATISVPAHGNNSALEIIMQESSVSKGIKAEKSLMTKYFQGTLVTAGEHLCQVASIPENTNAAAIQDNGEEVGNRTANITITKEEETISYELKMSNGELSEEEKGNMAESMKKACGNKAIEKITIKSTDADSFNKMANGEIVAVPMSNSRRNQAGCSNLKVTFKAWRS